MTFSFSLYIEVPLLHSFLLLNAMVFSKLYFLRMSSLRALTCAAATGSISNTPGRQLGLLTFKWLAEDAFQLQQEVDKVGRCYDCMAPVINGQARRCAFARAFLAVTSCTRFAQITEPYVVGDITIMLNTDHQGLGVTSLICSYLLSTHHYCSTGFVKYHLHILIPQEFSMETPMELHRNSLIQSSEEGNLSQVEVIYSGEVDQFCFRWVGVPLEFPQTCREPQLLCRQHRLPFCPYIYCLLF